MKHEEQIGPEFFDQHTQHPAGYRDKRGEWRPDTPVSYAPLFELPRRAKEFAGWLKGYLFPWNTIWFSLTLFTWFFLQPDLERCRSFHWSWITWIFLRNQALLWIIYGGWHLHLYIRKQKGHDGKYSPRWQNKHGSTFLFKNQVQDNIFWTCVSGGSFWTAYEVISFWMYANGRLPYLDPKESPLLFAGVLLLIPIWREFHFYWIHRLIHWKPLYDRIHYLHHYNINPGPWSGMAMHPLEHLLYFSVTLIHWIIPSHPIHFLFNAQHTALTPADSHSGFEGEVAADTLDFGSYFHYLHHRHFDCNYGEATIPLDKWFGSFQDGSRTETELNEARKRYQRYRVSRIVSEGPGVKSFELQREDGAALEPFAPGQHLLFKVPGSEEGKTRLRCYTLSDVGPTDHYRISVKEESKRPESASVHLHQHLNEGDILEARGPLGDFSPKLQLSRPLVLVAGGIGITPILAMCKGALAERGKRKIMVYLSFRRLQDQLFADELLALQQAHPGLGLHLNFSGEAPEALKGIPHAEAGRIHAARLLETPAAQQADFYICGPDAMMDELCSGLQKQGISEHQLHTERFQLEASNEQAATQQQHEVTFLRSGKTLLWDSEYRNLLEFAESNGISLDAGCMFGECGACAARVQEGDVTYNYNTAMKPQAGHCLPCSCKPASKLILDV